MKVKIDIDTQTFVRFGLVVLGFVLAIAFVFFAQGALVLIGAAAFLALALNPPVSWIARKLPGRSRTGATGIAYIIVISVLVSLLFLVIPPILEQTAKFAQTIPSLIDRVADQRSWFDDFINRYNLSVAFDNAINSLKSQAATLSNQLAVALVSGVSVLVGGIVNLILILVLCFFMLVEGPMWMQKIWDLYADVEARDLHRTTVSKMYKVVTGFVNGQIAVAAIGAMASFITLVVMSLIPNLAVPSNLAMPLAVIVFLTALIPMVGTTIGGVMVSLVLLLNSPLAALIFAIFFLIYQQIENNVISPPIQSKTVDLSVLWVLMAILIGASLFGLIGGLISIPIAGCIRILLVVYLERTEKLRAENESKRPVAKLLAKVKTKKA